VNKIKDVRGRTSRTIDLRAAVKSGQTRAYRLMVPHSTLGVRAAVARIYAPAVQTSPVRRALRVCGTGYGRHRWRDLACTAAAAHVTAGTFADHGPDRQRIDYHALGWPFARFQRGARVTAHTVEAGQQRRTVSVFLALWLYFLSAGHVRVARHSRRTSTQGEMVLYFALGLRRTRVFVYARVYTLAVDARSVVGTVVVASTTDHQAPVIRVSPITALAPTLGAAGNRETFGVRAAWIFYYARI